jgi:hypothetical protein
MRIRFLGRITASAVFFATYLRFLLGSLKLNLSQTGLFLKYRATLINPHQQHIDLEHKLQAKDTLA